MSHCSLAASLHPEEDSQLFAMLHHQNASTLPFISLPVSLSFSPCSTGIFCSCESSPLYWSNGSLTQQMDGLIGRRPVFIFFLSVEVRRDQVSSAVFCHVFSVERTRKREGVRLFWTCRRSEWRVAVIRCLPTTHVFAKIHCDVNIGLMRCLRLRLNPGQWKHNKPFLTQIPTHRQQKKDSLLATDRFLFYI